MRVPRDGKDGCRGCSLYKNASSGKERGLKCCVHCMHQPHPGAGLFLPRQDTSSYSKGTMLAAVALLTYPSAGRGQEEQPRQKPWKPVAWNNEGGQNTVQVHRLPWQGGGSQ